MTRHVLIGAHLLRDDVGDVDGVDVHDVNGILVSSIPLSAEEKPSSRSAVLRAAAIRQELIAREIFVAIRWGAVAGSDDDVAGKCEGKTAGWRRLLVRHRGEVEITLKVGNRAGAVRPQARDFESGRAYLEALHALRGSGIDPKFRIAVEEKLIPVARRWRWVERDDGGSELAALVSRDDFARLRRDGEELRSDFPDVPFLLSGPWPLEVFSDDDE